jgi:hypothetical protein
MRVFFSILCLFSLNFCSAQFMYNENRVTYLYVNLGPSKYLGDIGEYQKMNLKTFSLNTNTFFGGIGFNTIYKEKISFDFGVNYGRLRAKDADIIYSSISDSDYSRFRRNLDFNTNIFEVQTKLHAYPFKFLKPKSKVSQFKIQPYIMAGIGIFNFNPRGTYYDNVYNDYIQVDLQPLSTEGQGFEEYPDRKPYKLTQLNIPYGAGIYYQINEYMHLALGIHNRKLFTDYLDDVSTTYADSTLYAKYFTDPELYSESLIMRDKTLLLDPFSTRANGEQRGNSKKYDSYFNYNLTVGFKIGRKKSKKATYYKFDKVEICD